MFVFHENTNANVNGAPSTAPTSGRSIGEEDHSSGGGVEQGLNMVAPKMHHKIRPLRNGFNTYLAKVSPPRLNGQKVGVLGTRSPHRPNPVGLSMVKLEGVDMKNATLSISGLDLVDGTPLIDVKPVVPYDIPSALVVPEWVHEDVVLRRVVFSEEACEGIKSCVELDGRKRKVRFYKDAQGLKDAVTEVLVQDVRSILHGRGRASDELYACRFDGVLLHFVTTEEEIRVVSAE
ncbi:unnamed protein product [Discosporangium mesarthrocarpum]